MKASDAALARKYLLIRGLMEKNTDVNLEILTDMLHHVAASDLKIPKPIQDTITTVAILLQDIGCNIMMDGIVRSVMAKLQPMIGELGKVIEAVDASAARARDTRSNPERAAEKTNRTMETTCERINKGVKTYTQTVKENTSERRSIMRNWCLRGAPTLPPRTIAGRSIS